jgi:anti-sigma regulatory factor (Ser/Thr protein kinase)
MNKLHNRKTLSIQNSMAERDKLHSFLLAFAEANDIPSEIMNDLQLVVEEIFINIISYAYTDNESHDITLELDDNATTIRITFTDSGTAFDPLTYCNEMNAERDHCDGGMGIAIIKSLTDSQQYQRINQHNVFTVTKLYTKKNIKTDKNRR